MSTCLKKRRSFFLLEVMIAVILIGSFAYISLQGLYQSIRQQRRVLGDIEYARLIDLKRMEIIAEYWNKVEGLGTKKRDHSAGPIQVQIGSYSHVLVKDQKYKICAHKRPSDRSYLLSITEIREKRFMPPQKEPQKKEKKEILYHYLIKKDGRSGA